MGDFGYGAKWNIYYIGVNKDLYDIEVSPAGLKGGKIGTDPSV